MYIEENVNPKKRKVDDCAIRAVVKATGRDYRKVYFELCKIGDQVLNMPNSTEVLEKYLIENCGFIPGKIKVVKGSKRPTVRSFAMEHRTGTYILRVANHITVVVNGNYYDIWDCGDCAVYKYWSKLS
jgi:hypothetical protein